jgi:hypothetical protein
VSAVIGLLFERSWRLGRTPPGTKAFDPIWLAGFRINGRKVSRYRWGRAFLCGDAAHVHSPAGGHSMNTGMQDAFNPRASRPYPSLGLRRC